MDLNINGKIAIVCASSKGLGRAVAEALAAEGVNLALCSRDKNTIEKVGREIASAYNVDVLAAACDITRAEDINAFHEQVIHHFKTCHILFANAGGPPPGKVEQFKGDDFRKALELNLLSTINVVNAFLPYMKEQKWGRILANTSISVKQPIPSLALSNVSRVGVVAYIKSLAQEVGAFNVTANALAPGYIMTERVEQLLENQAKQQNIDYKTAKANLVESIPVKMIAPPSQFGALAAFLASEQAAYITGETILIDGGLYKGLM